MKAVFAIVFILFIGTAAQAQEGNLQQKAETIQKELVSVAQIQENMKKTNAEMARLYRRADFRVKKALSFSTKKDRGLA